MAMEDYGTDGTDGTNGTDGMEGMKAGTRPEVRKDQGLGQGQCLGDAGGTPALRMETGDAGGTPALPKSGPVVDERLREAMVALSARHRAWVVAFCQGEKRFCATSAAVAAGYSERRAKQTGAEIRAMPAVREAVEAFLASAETDAVMDYWEAAARLSAIGRSSLRQFVGADGRVDIEAGPEQGLQEVRITERTNTNTGVVTVTKTIKVRDPERAIRSLGEMLGWNPRLVFSPGAKGETPEELAEDMSKTLEAWRIMKQRARSEVRSGEVKE